MTEEQTNSSAEYDHSVIAIGVKCEKKLFYYVELSKRLYSKYFVQLSIECYF